MTDLERIGQRLVTGFPGTALTPELVQVVKEYKIGNIILFRENIASADQLRTLCADLQTLIRSETGHDAFIMIDQEGGAVTRLPESCINVPGSMALAATGDPETTYLAGAAAAEEVAQSRADVLEHVDAGYDLAEGDAAVLADGAALYRIGGGYDHRDVLP